MGIQIIKMPDIGEGIAEVELVAWHVKVGDTVAEDQILADVMTDKATVEIPSPVTGKVLALGGAVGEVMAVGSEVIRIEVDGKGNFKDEPAAAATSATATATAPSLASPAAAMASASSDLRITKAVATASEAPAARSTPLAMSVTTAQAATGVDSGKPTAVPLKGSATANTGSTPATGIDRPIAAPAVRRRAWELGVDLAQVPASGNAGQITQADLTAFAAKRSDLNSYLCNQDKGYRPLEAQEVIPVIGLRRKIAQKMQEAKRRIPHFTYVEEIDVTELEALRTTLNSQHGQTRGRLTLLPFLIRAMVLAVREHPEVNARYDDDAGVLTRYAALHVGLATQTGGGLMVPVIRHAETLDLWACAAEVLRLAEAARSGRATREELNGSTITLTSLGALGGIVSTPVINHPEVAIVGTNRIVERPMVKGGAVVIRKMMNLSSSFDHRVVDGLHAAEFIQRLRSLLECPGTLFVL
ncbi:MAG: 2-oxo acid dehydrogenase subunit E2 [Comamonadaceae bacterium]|nr:2-oxo acid dehydrogenase subunit E2 [Comamonadaceae bacterium]